MRYTIINMKFTKKISQLGRLLAEYGAESKHIKFFAQSRTVASLIKTACGPQTHKVCFLCCDKGREVSYYRQSLVYLVQKKKIVFKKRNVLISV